VAGYDPFDLAAGQGEGDQLSGPGPGRFQTQQVRPDRPSGARLFDRQGHAWCTLHEERNSPCGPIPLLQFPGDPITAYRGALTCGPQKLIRTASWHLPASDNFTSPEPCGARRSGI